MTAPLRHVQRIGPASASPGARLGAIARIVEGGEIAHAIHYVKYFAFDVAKLTREDRTALDAIVAKLAAGRELDIAVLELRQLATSLDLRPEMQPRPDVAPGDPVLRASQYESRARDAAREADIERRAGREHSAGVFEKMAAEDLQRARTLLKAAASREDDDAA